MGAREVGIVASTVTAGRFVAVFVVDVGLARLPGPAGGP
jgi:hypothetical protein